MTTLAPRLFLQQQTSEWIAPKEKPAGDGASTSPNTPRKKVLAPVRSPRSQASKGAKYVAPEPPSQIQFFLSTSPREKLSAAKEALQTTNNAARFHLGIQDELSKFEKRNGCDELTLTLAEAQQGGTAVIDQQPLPGKLIPLISSNPITGLLCNIPLYEFYRTFKEVSSRQRAKSLFRGFNSSSSSSNYNKREPLKLSVVDFDTMLKILVPEAALSTAYLERMLEPFELTQVYGTTHRVVNFVDVFSYLARCTGSAVVEHNLNFFLKALDPTKRGYLPTPLLSGRLLRSWTENRVVGGALLVWRKVCRAFEAYGDVETRLLESSAIVTLDELRVIVASSKELTEAFSVDLECQLTPGPRYVAAAPQSQTNAPSPQKAV